MEGQNINTLFMAVYLGALGYPLAIFYRPMQKVTYGFLEGFDGQNRKAGNVDEIKMKTVKSTYRNFQ